jgi:hypothetical protein
MKKIVIAIFLLIFSVQLVQAQTFHAPANPEAPINSVTVTGVLNTGADMIINDGNYSKVMVFDGNAPMFSWDTDGWIGRSVFYHNSQHPSGYLPVDPDVVLNHHKNR